jgi:predicted DCC family thiol-disulfide oxidoreductase YuxK
MEMPLAGNPVLLFDGVCNLCNASVQWILKRDRKGIFRFAALQSDYGTASLKRLGLSPDLFDSVILLHHNTALTRSDAALEIARLLGGFWSMAVVFKWIPRVIRNALYDWIARNRYKWFGKQEACMIPRPEWKNRFL